MKLIDIRTRGRAKALAIVAALTMFLIPLAAVAAAPSAGSITGSVLLPDGTNVAGATVTIRSQETGLSRVAVTGQAGDYRFDRLPAGRYEVSARADAGRSLDTTVVVVSTGGATLADIALVAGEITASALVTAPKADLQSSIASEIDKVGLAALRPSTSDTASLLRNIPGMSLYSAGGVSSLPALHGLADDRLRIKVDGMDLISACPNHMNAPLSYIDPTNVASVSVLAGISPVASGGDSIGGTIQVSSAAPEFATPGQGALLRGQASSFYRSNGNPWGASLSALVAGEALSLTYNGSITRSGNYKAAKEFKGAGLAATGQGWLAGDVVGSSGYEARNHQFGLALRHESHLVDLDLGLQDIPREAFPNQRMDMTGNSSRRANLRYTGQYRWGALEARVYHERTRHSMNYGDDKQFWYGTGNAIPGMPMDTEGRNAGAIVKGDFALSSRDTLKAGGEYQRFRLSDWWSPSGGGMAPDTFRNINDGQRDRLGAFAEWEARWSPRWGTHFGLRSDTVRMNAGTVQGYNTTMGQYVAESTAFNARDRQRTDHNWDVTALIRYTPGATQSYVAGYARKTRSPNLYERYAWSTGGMAMLMNSQVGDGNGYVGNLDLRPEVADTVSATADWHDAARGSWGISVTPYYTAVHDFVDVTRCSSANTNCGATNQSANAGFVYLRYANQSARLYGVDLSGRALLARTGAGSSLEGIGGVNYVRGENRTTGGNLYDIMPLNARLALVHHVGSWTNTVEAQAVAAKTKLSQVRNEVETPGYGLLHLRSSFTWEPLRFDLGIENLFDAYYSLPLGGAYVGQGKTMSGSGVPWGVPVPGPGRTLYLGVSVAL